MHCDCCDKLLDPEEQSAKFVEKDGTKTRFVNMCRKCRSFLPPDIKIASNPRSSMEQFFGEGENDGLDQDDEDKEAFYG